MTVAVVLASMLAATCAALGVAFLIRTGADRRVRALATEPRQPARPSGQTGPTLVADRVASLLDLIAAALDVGLAPVRALASVAGGVPEPDRTRLRRAVAMVDVGGEVATAWRMLADDPVLGPLAHALERSERSGAPVATTVRALADDVRRETRAARLAEARRVGVRTAAPLGACFLPAFFLIALVPTVIALVRSAL